jgi:hypothetical protein
MKTITDNPEEFFESGGWNFLDPDSGSEEEEETEDEEDEEFKVSDDDESDEVRYCFLIISWKASHFSDHGRGYTTSCIYLHPN